MIVCFGLGSMLGSLLSMYVFGTGKEFGWGMVIGAGMVTLLTLVRGV